MRVFIEPTEALSFRTGRPFDAGENTLAESIFPPTPETIQGTLRAAIATHWDTTKTLDEVFQNKDLVDRIGSRLNYGRFRITSFTLGRRKQNEGGIERLFPPPASILETKDEQENPVYLRLKPKEMDNVVSNMPSDVLYLLPPTANIQTKGKFVGVNGWLTETCLWNVLHTNEDVVNLGQNLVRPGSIFVRESRVGIGMQNNSKTTKDGFLYQSHMIRMQPNYGFVVDIHLSSNREGGKTNRPSQEEYLPTEQLEPKLLPSQGWLTLGGEQRAARFHVLDEPESSLKSFCQEDDQQTSTGTLLYLATPAYFENGWQPKQWDAPLAHPIAAAINKYQPIGGWLLNASNGGGENKCMRRCVPAGSVYFFEQPIQLTTPFTEYGWQIGYGTTMIGDWK